MSTAKAAILTSFGIVSVGFLFGQYLQPDEKVSTDSIYGNFKNQTKSHNGDAEEGKENDLLDISKFPLKELHRHLDNLKAMKKNVENEKSLIHNKLLQVERRIELDNNNKSF
ncbi:hypothetical protein BY996DRAFT_7289560 [Phakopsora pachyrhizi]|uniref:Uncharacterized protein n=1 Tax=Phakopsora pachyrhizi TaxID=170000 RepID=A0AAV0BRM5_PHAPC|nr:hypothetical protein BY996DRAFT_7507766 [Phakopsora pachyrhizi]KAI8451561.1 hypothetical protein BY996DRAFT_7289560 [Phakopsora pachyrhizi]CAH7688948.1 hypothetical protein PPACK8108_LOCUS23992 [Phakopsora pachyrhizi]